MSKPDDVIEFTLRYSWGFLQLSREIGVIRVAKYKSARVHSINVVTHDCKTKAQLRTTLDLLVPKHGGDAYQLLSPYLAD